MIATWWDLGGDLTSLAGWLVAATGVVAAAVLLVWLGWRVAGRPATAPILGVVLVSSGAAVLAAWQAAEAASGLDGLGYALVAAAIAVGVTLPTLLVGLGAVAGRLHARWDATERSRP